MVNVARRLDWGQVGLLPPPGLAVAMLEGLSWYGRDFRMIFAPWSVNPSLPDMKTLDRIECGLPVRSTTKRKYLGFLGSVADLDSINPLLDQWAAKGVDQTALFWRGLAYSLEQKPSYPGTRTEIKRLVDTQTSLRRRCLGEERSVWSSHWFDVLDGLSYLGPNGQYFRDCLWNGRARSVAGDSQENARGFACEPHLLTAEVVSSGCMRLAIRIMQDLNQMASDALSVTEAEAIVPMNLLDEVLVGDGHSGSNRPFGRLLSLWQRQLYGVSKEEWTLAEMAHSVPTRRRKGGNGGDPEEEKRRFREWRNGKEIPTSRATALFVRDLLRRAHGYRHPPHEFLWIRLATLSLAFERLQREVQARQCSTSIIQEAYQRQRRHLQV